MKRSLVLMSGIVLATLVLSACTSAARDEITLPPKNQDQWTMPLDQFGDSTASMRDYAEALLERTCLAEKGIDWPVPWQPIDRQMVSKSFTPSGARRFNAEIAATYGYHTIPLSFEGLSEWRDFVAEAETIASSTPGFEATADACLKEARKTIPTMDDENYTFVGLARSAQEEDALREPRVVDATRVWQECMKTAGRGGYAETPLEMPGDDHAMSWNIADRQSEP